MPRRVPNKFDVRFLNLFEGKDFALDIACDLAAEMATGSGQRHFDIDARTIERDVVDEAQVDYIERDFRIVAVSKLIPDLLFGQRDLNSRVPRKDCALRS